VLGSFGVTVPSTPNYGDGTAPYRELRQSQRFEPLQILRLDFRTVALPRGPPNAKLDCPHREPQGQFVHIRSDLRAFPKVPIEPQSLLAARVGRWFPVETHADSKILRCSFARASSTSKRTKKPNFITPAQRIKRSVQRCSHQSG
jgi:hypothetical protein